MPEIDPRVPQLTVLDAATQLTFAVHEILTRVAAEHDLSVTQLRLLGILRDRTPTMAFLAHLLALDRSSVTGLIDRAERRGLVQREGSPTDARVTTVHVTDAGRNVSARVVSMAERAVTDLLVNASDADRDALRRITQSLDHTRRAQP